MTLTTEQKGLKIAIQGYEGSFHHIAATEFFKSPIEVAPAKTFSNLIEKVKNSEETNLGIMAIENSIAGSILPNYTLLQKSNLTIIGEIYLQIGQHIMALPGQGMGDLREVHSHPMAILQCEKFFSDYPHIRLVEAEDTALSAKKIRDNCLEGVGAIASEMAADIYDLEIVQPHAETVRNNFTRFLILSPKKPDPIDGANKASLCFKLPHEPGALTSALKVVSDLNINLSKIQSFPIIEQEWEYYFHIDVEFDDEENYNKMITNLHSATASLKILGLYKKGKTI